MSGPLNPDMCQEPMLGPYGYGSATRLVPHDWRLFSREQKHYSDYRMQENAPGYGIVTLTPTAWVETWYCTRCRLTDRRVVPIEEA